MAQAYFTELTVKNFKPPAKGQLIYWDTKFAGFGLRVSQGGSRTWVVKHGTTMKSLGRWPVVTLAGARTEAKRVLYEQTIGKHRATSIRFEDALALFLSEKEKHRRPATANGYGRRLKHFPFGKAQLTDITKHEIVRLLDRLAETPTEQHHALVAAKVFFTWAQRRGYVEHSPCAALQSPARPSSRERVLSRPELAIVLSQAIQEPYPFGPIVRLLILTGQRKSEIGGLRWPWIDQYDRTITLPSTNTKNGREHAFPYGDLVAAVLEEIPFRDDYLFPAARQHVAGRPTTVFNGWSKATDAFRERCAIPHWTLHDIRRTVTTEMGELGVLPHIAERCINHVSGEIKGVAAIYNRAKYQAAMREAYTLWERHLAQLLAESE